MEAGFIGKSLPGNHKQAVYNCRFGKTGQTQKQGGFLINGLIRVFHIDDHNYPKV